MNIIRFWIDNARPRSLPQSFLPSLLANSLAFKAKEFSFWLGLLAIIGVTIGHLGINLFDDYFDYKFKKSEFRNIMMQKGFRARINKCNYITSNQATLTQLLIISVSFCSFSLGIGLIIWFFRDNFILYLALVTAILGFFYSAPPLRLSYYGLGEIIVGIIFGPLLMIGVYYAACGKIDHLVIFISIPIGLLVTNIIFVHSIMDYEPDKKVGKITLAVLLKNRTAIIFLYFIVLIIPFVCIFEGVFRCYLSLYYLYVFLTLPIAIALFYLMYQYIYYPDKKIYSHFWMFSLCNLRQIQTINIDWFRIRWLLARNMFIFFCFISIIVCLIS